jgi:hypothetical protein
MGAGWQRWWWNGRDRIAEEQSAKECADLNAGKVIRVVAVGTHGAGVFAIKRVGAPLTIDEYRRFVVRRGGSW